MPEILYDLKFKKNLTKGKQKQFQEAYQAAHGYPIKNWVLSDLAGCLIIDCNPEFVAAAHKMGAKFEITCISLTGKSSLGTSILEAISKNELIPNGHLCESLEIQISQ